MEREVNTEELRRELHKSLLNWCPFKKGEKVLYIGEKEDAYIDVLYHANVDLRVVGIHEIRESMLEDNVLYDAIICIAYLEYLRNPEKILKLFAKMIKPEGHLLLGMNNRLGIRYFCGDRDPYTDRNFDGVENYVRAYVSNEDGFRGRCYSKEECCRFLECAGWKQKKIYSVFPDLMHPAMLVDVNCDIHADDVYLITPCYNNPDTLFLEEENLYQSLIQEGMMHHMANAFFIDCTMEGILSDAIWIKTAIDRKKEDALVTICRENNVIEKRAVYLEGQQRLKLMVEYSQRLKERGVSVLEGEYKNGVLTIPFLGYKTGLTYLKELLCTDRELFLRELDRFRDLIMKSADIKKEDRGDGKGAILTLGYVDMVPQNTYYVDGEFVFWNQEFCVKNYPANALIICMIRNLYHADVRMERYLSSDNLFDRYNLKEKIDLWWYADWKTNYLNKNRYVLKDYYETLERKKEILNSNRQRINYKTEEYQKLFVDIFKNADTRKLILFGSGRFTKKFLTLYKDSYPVYAIIDNNSDKWGEKIDGITIYPPEYLKEFKNGEYKVIICVKNYLSVMKQLDELGVGDYGVYDWDKDYPRRLNPITTTAKTGDNMPQKYNIGYVAGVFDMFHVGHINLLKKAKEMCNYLIVGVLQDESVFRQKNKYPIISCEDRAEVVRSCRYADQVEVLPLDYAGIRDAHRLFHFDCQFSGDDHGDAWLKDKEFLNSKGADIVFFKYTEKVSSTMLREQLKEET